jgi:hypothetical protein
MAAELSEPQFTLNAWLGDSTLATRDEWQRSAAENLTIWRNNLFKNVMLVRMVFARRGQLA